MYTFPRSLSKGFHRAVKSWYRRESRDKKDTGSIVRHILIVAFRKWEERFSNDARDYENSAPLASHLVNKSLNG